MTCLNASLQNNHMEIFKRLLRMEEIDVNKSEYVAPPLHFACREGRLDIARVKSLSTLSFPHLVLNCHFPPKMRRLYANEKT